MSDKNKGQINPLGKFFVILGFSIGLGIIGIVVGTLPSFVPVIVYLAIVLVVYVINARKAKKAKMQEFTYEEKLKILVAQYRALPPDQRLTNPEINAEREKIRAQNPTYFAEVKEGVRAKIRADAPNVSDADIDTMMEILFGTK